MPTVGQALQELVLLSGYAWRTSKNQNLKY